jgi:tetratricopeptide (TPR) repeat protein
VTRDAGLLTAFALLLLSFADPAALADQGSKALDRGAYEQAEEIFSQLVAADPKDYFAYFNLALAELGLKKDEKAIANLKQTLELKPGLYQAQLNLGLVYLRNDQAAQAIPLFEAVVNAKPDDAKGRQYLAESYQGAGKWLQAGAEFQEVLKRDPKNARASLGVGESLLHQGKLDEAKPHFDQAVQLDPSFKPYLLEYAVALADAGHDDQALSLLAQFTNDAGACSKAGQLYLKAQQPEKAAESFACAMRLAPTPATRLALATAYLRSNQKDKAVPLLKEALAASPNDWELQMTIGRIYRDQKNYPEAANYFLNAGKLKPAVADAWSELAGVLTLMQQYPQALAALDKLHELNAEKPGHFYLRAIILDKLHQLKPALASYEQFLQTSNGQNPDQEFQARGRIKALRHEMNR